MQLSRLALVLIMLALEACGAQSATAPIPGIDGKQLRADIKTLSSDKFEGRAPDSRGEQLTINYLRTRFRQIGLRPGNGNSFFQRVPMVKITADPDAAIDISGDGRTLHLAYGSDMMVWTKRVTRRVELDHSPLIFVGYGIVAPEYHWNDYAGVDVKGKTVVILVNDPGYATGDAKLFHGKAMTYYGRWTYKYEEAARHGAAAALIVHETGPAGYPWAVVKNSWSGPQFQLVEAAAEPTPMDMEGWLTSSAARLIFADDDKNFDQLAQAAAQPGFKAVSLSAHMSAKLDNKIAQTVSHNVIGMVPGGKRPSQYIIYTAHWDHLGRDTSLKDDQIYNGAVDNASGVAGLLALAQAFEQRKPRPQRSILFLSVTGEEKGLLGSRYYTEHPIYPLADTVAEFNMDGLNVYGPTRDITVIGSGHSELEDYLARAAKAQGRVVRPDPEPEKGYYYRSDHFNFARKGVPALDTASGVDYVGRPAGWGQKMHDQYREQRYHKPSDEYDPSWNLRGAVQDLDLLYAVGTHIADEKRFPQWYKGDEFRAAREAGRQTGRKP